MTISPPLALLVNVKVLGTERKGKVDKLQMLDEILTYKKN